EAPPLVEHAVGQDRAVAQVAGPAEVVVDRVQVDPGRPHDLQGLGDDLGADPVAADDSDLVAHYRSSAAGGAGPSVARPVRETTNRPPRRRAVISGRRG